MSLRDTQAAREEAASYAAFRILTERYSHAVGAQASLAGFENAMAALCYPVGFTALTGPEPAVLGNRIAARVLRIGASDGSLEAASYADPTYVAVNDPLVVRLPGTAMRDPNRWQPLALDVLLAQNEVPIPGSIQEYVGPHWGYVEEFALSDRAGGLPLDPGDPP